LQALITTITRVDVDNYQAGLLAGYNANIGEWVLAPPLFYLGRVCGCFCLPVTKDGMLAGTFALPFASALPVHNRVE